MSLSVVIPTRNEAAEIQSCLAWLRSSFTGEILVVDGGSEDGTPALLSDCELLQTRPGLAHQCNEGARAATGDWLLFCSADSRPTGAWLTSLSHALASPYVVGGGFSLELEAPYDLVSFGGNFRARHERIALGDQGLFVKRSDYWAVGGMKESSEIPFARLCFDLRSRGEFVLLKERMLSSARAYRRDGLVKTVFAHARAYARFRRSELQQYRHHPPEAR